MTVAAYHGTDWMGFARFDIAEARICNVGLHFGTRAEAKSRIAVVGEEMVEYEKCRARCAA